MIPNDFPTVSDDAYILDPNTTMPTDLEQFLVELVNRARNDRDAEHNRILDNLDALALQPPGDPADYNIASNITGAAKQPLAWNVYLGNAADLHSQDMLDRNFFAHDNPDGVTARERAEDAGYPLAFMIFDESGNTFRGAYIGENLSGIFSTNAFFAMDQTRVEMHHANLWASDSHQQGFMNPDMSEVGMGLKAGSYTTDEFEFTNSSMVTQKFGDAQLMFLTGVVIDDADGDRFYDVGEGQGGVHVTAYNQVGTYTTSTFGSGGYSLDLPSGTYTVVFSEGDLGDKSYSQTVEIVSQNVKLDVFENELVQTDGISIFPDNSFADEALASFATLEEALASISAGQAISIDDTDLGDVGALSISVDGISIESDPPFDGDFTLSAGVESFTLRGGTNASATGNALDNTIAGSGGDNLLSGLDGNDDLGGAFGDDTLFGGEGNDLLRGGLGDDSHVGGAGDDTYIIRDAGDIIVEMADEGDDLALVRVDYTLSDNLEDGHINISAGRTLTGNALDNELRGNRGNDILFGLDGDDKFRSRGGEDEFHGGAGDDIYFVTNSATTVIEGAGEGYDNVLTSVDFTLGDGQEIEILRASIGIAPTLPATPLPVGFTLTGNEFSNRIIGNVNDDVIDGGLGNDILKGGGGSDIFVFTENWGTDRIIDFVDGVDLIDLSGAGITGLDDLTISGNRSNDNIRITDGFNTIVVFDQEGTEFTLEDFIFQPDGSLFFD